MNGQNNFNTGFQGNNVPGGYGSYNNAPVPVINKNDSRRFKPGHLFFDAEAYKERLSVKRLGSAVGLPLCMFFIVSNLFMTGVLALLVAIVGTDRAVAMMSNANIMYILNACITIFLLTVPFVFAVKFIKEKPISLLAFGKVSFGKTVSLFMLGMGVCALSNFASGAVSTIIDMIFGTPAQSSMTEFDSGFGSFLLMLLCIGILPALLEEFAIRGIVLGALRTKFSDTAAVFISAALFGILHGNLVQIPFAFGVGLILGYATVYSGSMLPAILIHAGNNSLSVIMDYALRGASPLTAEVTSLLYYAVMLLLGICGFIALIKTDKDAFRLKSEKSENTKQYFTWLCGSAWIITFIVFCSVEVAMVQGLI